MSNVLGDSNNPPILNSISLTCAVSPRFLFPMLWKGIA